MKHYGHFLPWAGRSVKYKADDIATLYSRKERLEQQLEELHDEITESEKEFREYIKDEWSEEEIQDAKIQEYNYRNSKRITK